MSLYAIGASVLGGDLPRAIVKSQETAAYKLADMSDAAAKTLGDGDPVMKINPGVPVDIVGPAALNAHGVSYTPVQLAGQDDRGVYWIRTSSLQLAPTATPPIASAPSAKRPFAPAAPSVSAVAASEGRPWWHYALLAGAVGVAGFGAYKIATGGSAATSRARFA